MRNVLKLGFITIICLWSINFVYTKYFYRTEAEQKIIKNYSSNNQLGKVNIEQELDRLNIELQKHEVGSNTYKEIKEVGCDINLHLNVKNQKWKVICE